MESQAENTMAAPEKGLDEERPRNPFSGSGISSKRLFLLVGILLLVGLVMTAIFVRSWSPGSGYSQARIAELSSQMAEPVADRSTGVASPAIIRDPPPARKEVTGMQGPTGVIAVPSAALRSGPSLDAKPLKAVVRERERVRIIKRVASTAGPDWVQIQTASGRTGWVWASVVKEARRRG